MGHLGCHVLWRWAIAPWPGDVGFACNGFVVVAVGLAPSAFGTDSSDRAADRAGGGDWHTRCNSGSARMRQERSFACGNWWSRGATAYPVGVSHCVASAAGRLYTF